MEKVIINSYEEFEKPPFILAKIIHPNSYPLTSSGYPIGLRLGSNRVTMPIHDY